MDSLLVRDYAPKSSIAARETFIARARDPVIDVHAHVNANTPAEVKAWVRTMDEVGIETTIILTGATGAKFDGLVELYLKPYPTRFQLYCGLDTTHFEQADYPQRAVAELVRCYRKGARGVGELTDKGYGMSGDSTLPRTQRLHPDDPRLDAFWKKCADLKIPVNVHIADHPSCWKPLDVYQERTPDYQHFNLYGKDVPSYEELIAIRDRTLAGHSTTRFVACHLGNQGHDLTALSKELDSHPNLYLDISARDYEVGRTPRAAAKFLASYRTRVLFGSDMGREKSMYQAWWRLFESADEFMPGRMWWRYYGLELPSPVLASLYRENARSLMNRDPL
jgi:predicted TIM-barrel fold metal-dependent hydrolase